MRTTRALRTCAIASALAAVAACAKKDAGAADSASAMSAASASSTSPSGGMTQGEKQDYEATMASYRLSDENVNKAMQATQKMRDLEKAHPELDSTMSSHGGNPSDAKTIDEMARRLDAIPPAHAILTSVGLSARDYALTTLTLMEASAAYQMQKAGKLPPQSELARDVNPANIAWVGSHQAALQAFVKASGAGSDSDE